MRQFAEMVGVSNPYMSQIERGLRACSEKVLAEIARNLDVSADALDEQAGMSDAPEGEETNTVRVAIRPGVAAESPEDPPIAEALRASFWLQHPAQVLKRSCASRRTQSSIASSRKRR